MGQAVLRHGEEQVASTKGLPIQAICPIQDAFIGFGGTKALGPEYLLGRNPLVPDPLRLTSPTASTDAVFSVVVEEPLGRSVTLKTPLDLTNWFTVTNFTGTNATILLQDSTATSEWRFYRALTE